MIDKSNIIIDNKHLVIVSKHLIDNIPYMHYLGIINLEETDASYIFNQLKSFISSNHCISYRLHLAGKDASSNVEYFKEYENILHKIYSYFSRSHKHQKMLHV